MGSAEECGSSTEGGGEKKTPSFRLDRRGTKLRSGSLGIENDGHGKSIGEFGW